MEVDHAGRRLALLLTDAEGRGAELATLSGGERTFLRTMLVAALWELAPAPFRALDEFEVFLDPAARAEAARRLVEVALNKDSFQFLFIRWVPGGLTGGKPLASFVLWLTPASPQAVALDPRDQAKVAVFHIDKD